MGRGDEGRVGGVGVRVKGKHSRQRLGCWESWRSGGREVGGWVHVHNGDALSAALYCTLSPIGAQIRASHYNHLHTDHCTMQRCHHRRPFYVAAVRKRRRSCPAAVHAQAQHQKGHLELQVLLCCTWLSTHGDAFRLDVASVASLRVQICLACWWCRWLSSAMLMRPSAAVTAPRHGSPSTHLL